MQVVGIRGKSSGAKVSGDSVMMNATPGSKGCTAQAFRFPFKVYFSVLENLLVVYSLHCLH